MSDRFTSKSGFLLWAACLVTALTVSLLVQGRGGASTVSPLASAPVEPASVRALEERIAQLETRLHELQRPVIDAPEMPVTSRRSELSAAVDHPPVDELLADIDRRLDQLESRTPGRRPLVAPRTPDLVTEEQQRRATEAAVREAAHATILDLASADSAKARAWCDLPDLDEPWTDDIVLAMTHLGTTSEDDRARELVWIGAESDERSELLVQPMIQALLSDPVANVREEAADALSQYLDAPGVRDALLLASRQDASEAVREEALKALRGEE